MSKSLHHLSLRHWNWLAFTYVCVALTSCGSSHVEQADKEIKASVYANGKVVNPGKVPGRLARTGLHIVFRTGPEPADFGSAIYGIASNSHGTHINFGFFFVPNDTAGTHFRPALKRLVPGATDEGSTSGESFIAITSAGIHGKATSRKTAEEFRIAGTLQEAVAGLARKALEEEGP